MSLKKRFGTDKQAVQEGVWIELVDNDDGTTARIKVRRMSQQNPEFIKELANHRKAFQADYYSSKQMGKMQASMIEVMVSTIIVAWEHIQDWRLPEGEFPNPDAEPKYLEFTKDNVRMVLIEFPDLLDLITEESSNIENYKGDTERKN